MLTIVILHNWCSGEAGQRDSIILRVSRVELDKYNSNSMCRTTTKKDGDKYVPHGTI